ncbi:Holliday junction resolvase RuvX [candidate division KSB1 bacterium]|nr:Holliday junction resolvase RuvX [candidate division KSB1 bacterium]
MKSRETVDSLLAIGPGRILGLDYGKRRIGVALSDPDQLLCFPLETIPNKGCLYVCERIKTICVDKKVAAAVIGLPVHLDGRMNENTEHVQNLQTELQRYIAPPVFLWDERWSTVSAHKTLIETGRSPSKSREKVDQIAAAFILQSFLDRLRNVKNRN